MELKKGVVEYYHTIKHTKVGLVADSKCDSCRGLLRRWYSKIDWFIIQRPYGRLDCQN